jgi:membrane-associated phospholipid phosphatase
MGSPVRSTAILPACLLVIASQFASPSYASDDTPITVRTPHFQSGSSDDRQNAGNPVVNGVWSFAKALGGDFSAQATYPIRLAGQEPMKFLFGAAGLAALIASDRSTQEFLAVNQDTGFRITMQNYSDAVTARNAFILAGGFGVVGIFANSQRERTTSMMLVESLVTSGVWTEVLKKATRRERPREVDGGRASDWTGPGTVWADDPVEGGLLSFPSGHSTGSWAVATVLAHQYPSHGIVPVVAYSAAAMMSYSRMAVDAHWLSDVTMGALIGFGCARQVISAHEERRAAATELKGWQLNMDVTKQHTGLSLSYDF